MIKGKIKNQLSLSTDIINKFVSHLDSNQLYFGLSLLDDKKQLPYRYTLNEYENNVFNSMSLLIKLDRTREQCIPVVPRHNYTQLKDKPLPDTVHYVVDDTQVSQYSLYKILSGHGNIVNLDKPGRLDDTIKYQLIKTYTRDEVLTNWTKLYCTVPTEYGIENNITEYMFYSLPYPEDEVPVLTNCVSLIYNPRKIDNTLCTDDYYWYSHRVKLTSGIEKTGSFYVHSDSNITGIINQYTPNGYGIVRSAKNDDIQKKLTSGSRLKFEQTETPYTVESILKSEVESMSGYTLYTQKFKEVYCNAGIKLVISLQIPI